MPESWWPTIRDETPAYDPQLTPTRAMGAIVDEFRCVDGVRRSLHPQVSFAAVGPNRDVVVAEHELTPSFGEGSPLARLYELDAWVLLLGVGHSNNTSLHLAEHRADYPKKQWITQHAPLMVDGERQWVEWEDLEPDDSDFVSLGVDFAPTGSEIVGPVGAGSARLIRQRPLVDFATTWFSDHRRQH